MSTEEFEVFATVGISLMLENGIVTFQQVVDKFKSFKKFRSLLDNEKLFKDLIKNNKLNKEDLRYLLNTIDNDYELQRLCENTSLLSYIVDKNILSFKEVVDKLKISCWSDLLKTWFFRRLIESNKSDKLTQEGLKCLLNKINDVYELSCLCRHYTPLVKKILNEYILNKELVDKFNTLIENDDWCKDENIHTIFGYIEFYNKNKEILKLSDLNRIIYTFDLNENQKLELIELIKDNEIAQNRLTQIVDSNLESTYDFDSLMGYLKKQEKKNTLNI